ncbi:MAG: leucine-rich repeat domain-containing protein [Clostridia bacterium]|nr:leucine-rich repeat domain-containing protein [Clostridia bacterium]
MIQPKCLECGGIVDFNQDTFVGKCRYCGNVFIFDKPLNNENLVKYEIATDKLRSYDFDEAEKIFTKLTEQAPNEEFYWGAFLSEFGVDIVLEEDTQNVILYKLSQKSIFESQNFRKLMMLQKAEKERYNSLAIEIERIKAQINSIYHLTDNDICICHQDESVNAQIVSSFLVNNGYKVYVCDDQKEAQNYCGLSKAKTLIILQSQDKNLNFGNQKKYWQRFLKLHPYSLKNNIITIGKDIFSLPQKLQSYSFVNYNDLTAEKILNLLKDQTILELDTLKSNDNKLFERTENIKKELEKLNLNLEQKLEKVLTSSTKADTKSQTLVKREIYNLIEKNDFDSASESFESANIQDLYDYYLIRLLLKFKQSTFEDLINYLKNHNDVLYDDDFENLCNYSSNETKRHLSLIFENFIDYVYLKEKEFAYNSTIDNNGNLIKYVFVNKQEDVIMCQGIKGILSNSMLVLAKTFTISDSVEFMDDFVFNLSEKNMRGFNIDKLYIPNNLKSIGTNTFFNNLNVECEICFQDTEQNYKTLVTERNQLVIRGFKPKLVFETKSPLQQKLERIFNLFPFLKQVLQEKRTIIQEYLDIQKQNYKPPQILNEKTLKPKLNEQKSIMQMSTLQNAFNEKSISQQTEKVTDVMDYFSYQKPITTNKDLNLQPKPDLSQTINTVFSQTIDTVNVQTNQEQTKNTSEFLIIKNNLIKYYGKDEEIKLPQGILTISESAFKGNEFIKTLIISDSVKNIQENAFSNLPQLKRVVIGNGLEVVRYNLFKNCKNLESVILGENLKEIQQCAFENCKSLREIVLNKNLKTISTYAFKNCKNLSSVKVKSYDLKIEEYAFYNSNRSLKLLLEKGSNISRSVFGYDTIGQYFLIGDDKKLKKQTL